MKKFVLATTALAALVAFGPAEAADRPVLKGPTMVRPLCAQFGGFYLGANGGWAHHDKTWVDRDAWVDNFAFDWALGTVASSHDGGTAGGQIGYNWQRNCTVFGVEVDANWVGLSSTKTYSPVDGPVTVPGTLLTLDDRVRWFGTARARAGVVVDDLLLFVTGGLAYANIRHDFTVTDSFTLPQVESFSANKDRWGGVAGFGVEWAWAPNWSVKFEGLYIKFKEVTTIGFSPNGPSTVHFDNQDSMWITRIGINYRLGGGPVYAAY
jgi:outer membrane immunogenic protein